MYVKGCAAKLLATLSVLFSPTYHSLRIRGDLFPSAVAELLSFHDLPLHPLPLFASNDVSLGPTEEVRRLNGISLVDGFPLSLPYFRGLGDEQFALYHCMAGQLCYA